MIPQVDRKNKMLPLLKSHLFIFPYNIESFFTYYNCVYASAPFENTNLVGEDLHLAHKVLCKDAL